MSLSVSLWCSALLLTGQSVLVLGMMHDRLCVWVASRWGQHALGEAKQSGFNNRAFVCVCEMHLEFTGLGGLKTNGSEDVVSNDVVFSEWHEKSSKRFFAVLIMKFYSRKFSCYILINMFHYSRFFAI